MPTNDLRTQLANAIRNAHEAIEGEMALAGDVTLERYIAYLRSMHAVTARFEGAVDAALERAGLAAPERRKAGWLEHDLRYFGAAPLRHFTHAPGTFAARVGWAYVLEGATLGGRVLLKRLAPRWSLTPSSGGAFLCGYGERTGEMWRSFVEALNAIAFTPAQAEACIAGATQAFEAIGEAFRASVAGADLGLGRDARDRLAAT